MHQASLIQSQARLCIYIQTDETLLRITALFVIHKIDSMMEQSQNFGKIYLQTDSARMKSRKEILMSSQLQTSARQQNLLL
jgi:hypothetical protein